MSNPVGLRDRVEERAGCGSAWPSADRCFDRIKKSNQRSLRPVTKDTLQDMKIAGLQQEVSELHKLVGMLLTLVDPEDVRAAVALREVTPSNDELLRMAAECEVPVELRGVREEKPW